MVDVAEKQVEWRLEEAEIQRIYDVYMADQARLKVFGKLTALNDSVSDICDGNDDLLIEVYSRLVGRLLFEFVEFLEKDPYMVALLSVKSVEDLKSVGFDTEKRNMLYDLVRRFRAFGFDRAVIRANYSKPLRAPFNNASIFDPKWENIFEISEHFGHALGGIFDGEMMVSSVFSVCYWDKVGDSDFDDISEPFQSFRRFGPMSVPLSISIFKSFYKELLHIDERQDVNAKEMLSVLPSALSARFFEKFGFEIPIEINCSDDLVIHNADIDELRLFAWEGLKNAVRDGKISREAMAGYIEKGEPYITINVGTYEFNGKELLGVEIRDRGQKIDNIAVACKYEEVVGPLDGYEKLDVPYWEMIDVLSQNRVFVPLAGEGSGDMRTGIGAHTMKRIVEEEHKGRFVICNLPDSEGGGVVSSAVIPVQGKASPLDFSSRDGLKGKDLARMFGAIRAKGGDRVAEKMLATLRLVAEEERGRQRDFDFAAYREVVGKSSQDVMEAVD